MSQSIRQLWVRWKSLKLPWRSKWIAGQDLTGVLFWEHVHSPLSPTRTRRTCTYPRTTHPSDVLLSPAWLQWLRHTRPLAPTMQEQTTEMQRQSQLKYLAQRADERWNAKTSYLDRPERTGRMPAEILEPRDRGGYGQVDPRGLGTPGSRVAGEGKPLSVQEESSGVKSVTGSHEEVLKASEGEDVVKGRFKGPAGPTEARERDHDAVGARQRKAPRTGKKENPWEQARSKEGGGEWQPQSWTPPPAARR